MSFTTTTPYMNLILPIPGLETGPQYAIELDQAFVQVDQHTHTPGQGLPITSVAIDINADLSFNSFNLTNLRSSRYISQISPLALSTDLNCVYVTNGELFYNDSLGNQVQITLGGAVDTSSSGNITGMGATTASVVYTALNNTFSFYSNVNTPANMLLGPTTVGLNSTNTNTRITIQPTSTQPTPYTMSLPSSLPSAEALVSIDNVGQQRTVAPDNITTQIVSNQLVALFPPGMMIQYGGTAIPSGWLLCDGSAISRSTFSTLFAAIGTAYGYGDTSTTFNIPDCRGIFLRGVSGVSGNDPDTNTRTAANPGGNTGNNVGSLQGNAFTSHTHVLNDPGHTHSLPVYQEGTANNVVNEGANSNQGTTNTDPAFTSISIDNTGGSETRPLNLYVNYLIKT